jgi:hypothetical protein
VSWQRLQGRSIRRDRRQRLVEECYPLTPGVVGLAGHLSLFDIEEHRITAAQ